MTCASPKFLPGISKFLEKGHLVRKNSTGNRSLAGFLLGMSVNPAFHEHGIFKRNKKLMFFRLLKIFNLGLTLQESTTITDYRVILTGRIGLGFRFQVSQT
jgi:hypothetical protein